MTGADWQALPDELARHCTPEERAAVLEVFSGDDVVNSHCARCGQHAALFVFFHALVGPCPRCAVARIEALRARGVPIERRDSCWDDRDLLRRAGRGWVTVYERLSIFECEARMQLSRAGARQS